MEEYFPKVKGGRGFFGEGVGSKARIRAPRKRFRKKVNGLFGEQTDLKRRMIKLLRTTSKDEVLGDGEGEGGLFSSQSTWSTREREPEPENGMPIKLDDEVLDSLPNGTGEDWEADSGIKWHPKVTEILGSPEKVASVKAKIGKLSPRCNEEFLVELHVGESATRSDVEEKPKIKIAAPKLPEFHRNSCLVLSNKSPSEMMERTGAPAMLRKKVRRSERGYKSAAVLQARLAAAKSSSTKETLRPRPGISLSQCSTRRNEKSRKRLFSSQISTSPDDSPSAKRRRLEFERQSTQNSIALLVEAAEVTERQNSSGSSGGFRLHRRERRKDQKGNSRQGLQKPHVENNVDLEAGSSEENSFGETESDDERPAADPPCDSEGGSEGGEEIEEFEDLTSSDEDIVHTQVDNADVR